MLTVTGGAFCVGLPYRAQAVLQDQKIIWSGRSLSAGVSKLRTVTGLFSSEGGGVCLDGRTRPRRCYCLEQILRRDGAVQATVNVCRYLFDVTSLVASILVPCPSRRMFLAAAQSERFARVLLCCPCATVAHASSIGYMWRQLT